MNDTEYDNVANMSPAGLRATNARLSEVLERYRSRARRFGALIFAIVVASIFTHLAAAYAGTYLERERNRHLEELKALTAKPVPSTCPIPPANRRDCIEQCFMRPTKRG